MGITSNTPARLQLGVGDIEWNDISLGATGPEGSFGVTQEIHWAELGGARGPIAGTGWIVREQASLTMTLKEWTIANLAKVLPGIASSSDASSEYTTQAAIGLIASTGHKTVKWTGALSDGTVVIIELSNALATPELTWTVSDTGEWGMEVTFESYYTAAAPTTRTWKVSIAT